MTPTEKQTIKALDAAGDLATEGEWARTTCDRIYAPKKYLIASLVDEPDRKFIAQSANARLALKAMLKHMEEQDEEAIETQKAMFNQAKTIQKQWEVIEVMRKTLEGAKYAIKGREHTGFIDDAITQANEILGDNSK